MQEKTIQLRSGQALLLRQVHPEDARAMLNYLERTSAETHFMVRLPEEVTFSLEEEQAPIMRLQSTCITSAVFGRPEEFRGLSICRMAAASMKSRW